VSSAFIEFQFSVKDGSKERFDAIDEALRVHLRRAMAEVGAELRDAARSLAPRRKKGGGALARSIRARFREMGDDLIETVRPTKFYGKFLEFGVVNHGTQSNKAIGVGHGMTVKRAKVARVRHLRSLGQWRITPRPFMRPALHSMEQRIREAVGNALADAVVELEQGAQ